MAMKASAGLGHLSLALVHARDHVEFAEPAVAGLAQMQRLGDHADDLSWDDPYRVFEPLEDKNRPVSPCSSLVGPRAPWPEGLADAVPPAVP